MTLNDAFNRLYDLGQRQRWEKFHPEERGQNLGEDSKT